MSLCCLLANICQLCTVVACLISKNTCRPWSTVFWCLEIPFPRHCYCMQAKRVWGLLQHLESQNQGDSSRQLGKSGGEWFCWDKDAVGTENTEVKCANLEGEQWRALLPRHILALKWQFVTHPLGVSIKHLDSSCHSRSVFIEGKQISLNIHLFHLHICWSLNREWCFCTRRNRQCSRFGDLSVVSSMMARIRWNIEAAASRNVSGMKPHRTTEPMEVIQSMQQHPSRRPVKRDASIASLKIAWWPLVFGRISEGIGIGNVVK